MTSQILSLLRDTKAPTINGLAQSSGEDPRWVRIALLGASADGLVEVDSTFQTWSLTDAGRSLLDGSAAA
jgi:hypothetical protein